MKIISLPFLYFFFHFFIPNRIPLLSIEVPIGGNTFQTKGEPLEILDKNGIKTWTSTESEWSTFIYAGSEKKITLSLELSEIQSKNKIDIWVNDGKIKTINLKNSSEKIVKVGTFPLKKGYNIIYFKGNIKGQAPFPKIQNLKINYQGQDDFKFVRDNIDQRFYWGRRGPSVHLSYEMPENTKMKWFYNEMTIPKGKDPVGSYFMSNGFKEGYFGIQVNSSQERRILFSIWSPFPTDNPKEIPENLKIKLLKKGENVYTGEFGNEGSGGQSYLVYPWQTGITYLFLTSIEPDGLGNTTFTSYFKDPAKSEWILIAGFLRPQTNTWYTRPHSFLENFKDDFGYFNREVWYQNQWMADENGNWTALSKAKFTGDDIARRQYRMDADGGIKEGIFYLRNGGFFSSAATLNSSFSLETPKNSPLINLGKLP